MRLLHETDLRWVAGGLPASGAEGESVYENGTTYIWGAGAWWPVNESEEDITTVTVNGTLNDDYDHPEYDWGDPDDPFDVEDWAPENAPPQVTSDQAVINVTTTFTPNADQLKLITDFANQIKVVDAAIKSLPDNAKLTLSDGKTITGSELKLWWSLTDFVVDPPNTTYPNGANTSEANFNNGNPVVSVSVDVGLGGYFNYAGNTGFNQFIFHELAHFSSANRDHYDGYYSDNNYTTAERAQHEMETNDIARAFMNYLGVSHFAGGTDSPVFGYSTANPMAITLN
ncbi:hypothetical protein OVA03_07635 [Asticcacaulis sp. SL142]|uniref:hypothetical protein n=1 Tax=Asticcacaulis sp. SL142 TaxID=2995155 RepID=UPI00226D0E10|nr:hypothetical protein [Asticcacaulis sp. SL142]WAC49760.1 hypothetical protein OVA03_07635 [Asticcacaulis sp. SL142]